MFTSSFTSASSTTTTPTAGEEELNVEFTITAHHKGHVELGVGCLDPPPTGFSRPKRRVAASRWSQISLAVPLPPSPPRLVYHHRPLPTAPWP